MDKFDNIISDCFEPTEADGQIVNSVMDRVSFSCIWKRFKYIIYIFLIISFVFSMSSAIDSNFFNLIKLLFSDYDIVSSYPKLFWQALFETIPWTNLIIIILFMIIVIAERHAIRRYLMLRKLWTRNPIKN